MFKGRFRRRLSGDSPVWWIVRHVRTRENDESESRILEGEGGSGQREVSKEQQ